jgi:hypothetical protein
MPYQAKSVQSLTDYTPFGLNRATVRRDGRPNGNDFGNPGEKDDGKMFKKCVIVPKI